MLSILVFEIKEGKNAQKIKIINNNLSLLSGRNVILWGHKGDLGAFAPPPPGLYVKKRP
jgi:hypothetical protein